MPTKSPIPPSASPSRPAAGAGRRIQTRRSAVHGNGVFARQPLAEGECIIEYVGEVISWKEALRRHPHDPAQPNHTFYFHIDDKRVIDGGVKGNAARWINHSCEPNCIADEDGGRVFIKALRDIEPGEELNYDYGLVIDEPYTPQLLADFPCWCGAATCRGTLLAPKDDDGEKKKQKKKKKDKKAKDGKKKKKDAKKKDKARAG
ncbi:MAG: SET domain-containing protein-lysine N-methyltransferase [Xenophilus sp.]